MRAKPLIALAAAAVLTASLAACGGGGGESASGDMKFGLGAEPPSLIPPNTTESEGSIILSLTYAGLFDYNEKAEAENLLAKSIETKDNKTWTIEIEDGHKFHNGEPVDAEAFKRAWDWGAYAPNAATGSYFFDRIKGFADMQGKKPKAKELAGLKADGQTLTIELDKPWAGFSTMLGYTAFLPMAEECVKDTKACNDKPIGNGPMKFDGKWKHKESISLVKNDKYKGPNKVKYDKADFTIYDGDANCWADFESEDIDICSPPVEKWEGAKNDPDLKERLISEPSTSLTYLGMPVYDKAFQDKKLRQAFSLAIDREKVIDIATPGRAVPATEFAPPSLPGGVEGACEFCKFDAKEAKKLFEESSWPKGKKMEIWYNADPTNKAIFEAVGNQLKKNLGVEFELVVKDWDPFLAATDKHKAKGPFRMGWLPDYPLNENYLKPIYGNGAANNRFGYEGKDFNKKLAEADAAKTLEEGMEIYAEAEKILAEEMIGIPLSWAKSSSFYSENIDPKSVKYFPVGQIQYDKLAPA
ncbi:peptide ABC transporter substrate-binding protein [Stackebrandtia nassauensis]|uniref:Extracellular solute-binding protein family 5 n=1 Tax=Stackebrandtia nassauensis (strain DSM 44728 / CIP 108903 / NRRL B-16338 / NBRC 102104 / LLR-40K-21) TaxID=446470 RepID=D3Q145_STANL|nr:ABC transporter substrate-binding protein [Stackebrandtia nassauensis]ADD43795.1 extracellular solute-binding protein family 5 [Stackebrandtia nassauensis DSM 44728]